jgi:hypothetical protein
VKRSVWVAAIAALTIVFVGCGEKAQTAGQKKADAKAWDGADAAFTAGGWKSGDQKSWEEQMRARAQAQNEYARTTPSAN